MEDSKLIKYGSRSVSLNLSPAIGKRPKICGPGVVCAAVEGKVCSGGDIGVPLADVCPPGLIFADAEGIGNQLWAGVGFAGSRGGAFRLFLGTEDTG